MPINRLKLTNYRNIKAAELEFSPAKNLFYGPNGSGKTNLLEALFYCGTGRSFRTHLDEHLVQSGAEFFRLEARGHIAPHEISIEIAVQPGKQKLIKINSAPVKKVGELFEYFRLVEFSPYDLSLVMGAPSVRRRFLSLTISQSEPTHLAILHEYNQTLAQRNALLKTFQDQRSLSADQEANLSVWDEKLAEPAVKIHQARQSFLHNISPLAQKYYEQISGQAEEFALTYHPSPRLEDYTWENFCRKLFSRRGRELAFGQTMYGPHRDDLALSINNLDAHDAGSQGQIKTAVLSLKLAQFSYLQNRLERPPILLLDEIFSDLDSQRLSFIMNLFPSFGQVFITTSKLSEINELDLFNCKFELKNGIPTIL